MYRVSVVYVSPDGGRMGPCNEYFDTVAAAKKRAAEVENFKSALVASVVVAKVDPVQIDESR